MRPNWLLGLMTYVAVALASHVATKTASAEVLATATYDTDSYVFFGTNNVAMPEITLGEPTSPGVDPHYNIAFIKFDVASLSPGGRKYLELEPNVTTAVLPATVRVALLDADVSDYFAQATPASRAGWLASHAYATTPLATMSISASGGKHYADVTGAVDGWLADPSANFGLALWRVGGDGFDSPEFFSMNDPLARGPALNSVPEPGAAASIVGAALALCVAWAWRRSAPCVGAFLCASFLSGTSARAADEKVPAADGYVDYTAIAEGVTSFGAAVVDDTLYVYGGHRGGEHDYSADEQSNQFRRLRLAKGAKWEDLPAGPKLQGLAVVAHGGKLYRIGGFSAYNRAGEEHDLRSVADVAVFNPATKKWKAGPPLPEPRSSHDAAVLGDKLFVAGGWQLRGKEEEPVWHETAYVLDLAQNDPRWEALPKPSFTRRALSLGAVNGKVYAIGGMQTDRKVSCAVDVYDASAKSWAKAASLPGRGMDGFGTSAFSAAGKLYVSNVAGNVFRFEEEEAEGKWEVSGQLREKRLFHRMLATADDRLLIVGGAEWQNGKATAIYAVPTATKR